MFPRALYQQPVLVRLMVGLALLILPAIAWVDYQLGYRFAAAIEAIAAITLLCLIPLIQLLGVKRAARLILLIMFVLAALGSVEKLGSTPNFAWFAIMPFLYIAVGGLGLGTLLTVAHFVFIIACYLLFGSEVVAAIDTGTWIQLGLAYFTAAGLAAGYEYTQRQLRLKLRALADHDPLTGLLNRRGMEKRLHELTGFLRRHEIAVTLALLDIDHFKRVNDEFGHDVGDAALSEIGRELKRLFRESDYIARWGGEEFLVALTHTNLAEAATVLERLRSEVSGLESLSVPSLTLSMGAAEWQPNVDLSIALKQADVALYEAKQTGRNKLVLTLAEGKPEDKSSWSFIPERDLPADHRLGHTSS